MKNKETLGMINRCQFVSSKIAERSDYIITTLFTLRDIIEKLEQEKEKLERKMKKLEGEVGKLRIENQRLKLDSAKALSRQKARALSGVSIE